MFKCMDHLHLCSFNNSCDLFSKDKMLNCTFQFILNIFCNQYKTFIICPGWYENDFFLFEFLRAYSRLQCYRCMDVLH
ncbi:hypothetical protein XENTR_v10009332 [Xenopus tropicalis]|nr:hypothetical protein XENTR_v10009332 [Xenopus tropicalis]